MFHPSSHVHPLHDPSGNEKEIRVLLDSDDLESLDGLSRFMMRPSSGPSTRWLTPWKCSHLQCDARPWSSRALFCRLVRRPLYALLFFIGLAGIFSVAWNGLLAFIADARDTDIFTVYDINPLSGWFTHGVTPVPCHSHDDYWRQVPLYSALAAGCISVEADVWLDEDELRVGHTLPTVLRGHTLRNLYLNPLLEMLQRHDPRHSNDTVPAGQEAVGVFATDPSQTLVLLVDIKADGESTWPLLMEHLQPLREEGYLSYFDGSEVVQRQITVVVTGDAPFHHIENTTTRDVFYDAPLDKLPLALESPTSIEESIYNTNNSYYASVNFRESIGSLPTSRLSQAQLAKVRDQIRVAHEHGLKVRYWDTPKWPAGLRNYVWRVLVEEGVDILNVDDLHGATKGDWKSRSWWP